MWLDDPRDIDARERPTRGRGGGSADEPRDRDASDPRDAFARGLDLPRGRERERVYLDRESIDLRGSEVRALATIGAFRVVPVDDLRDGRGRSADVWRGDLEHLREAGLVRLVAPHQRSTRSALVTLTDRGRALLESHRTRDHEPAQTFYAGVARSRELAHDAQLYRAYMRAAERAAGGGAEVHRVALDYELKRDYQRFLQERNRERSDSDGRPTQDRDEVRAWAEAHDLPMLDDRVHFPDVQVEYEWPDGRREVENIEVVTPHYRGAHAAAKARAGFSRYRSSGGRIGGRSGRGGRGIDPRLAEEFLR